MSEKLFGTDGIRGVANVYPLTSEFCHNLAVILSRKVYTMHRKVAIARDTRISGDMLFCALAAGFTSQGVDVLNLGIIPTPLCTTLTPQLNVDMSIMITASHNPYTDNGLKLITADGEKFADNVTDEIEKELSKNLNPRYNPHQIGCVHNIDCGLDDYFATVNKITVADSLYGLRIVLDSANGAFTGILSQIFKYLGAEIISLADYPDGYNINFECGTQHTEQLCRTVVENEFDLGIAVDGDGDRIIICDDKGKRIDGDQILAYLATYMKNHNMLKGTGVVSTIYSNLGLGKYIHSLGLEHYTSAVGERHVIAKMHETECNLGGEESGHIVLSDYTRTGDALLTAILVCLGIYESKLKVSEIFPVFKPFPAQSHNLRFKNQEVITKILEDQEVKNTIKNLSEKLTGHGNILVRKSGTEPVIRLKIEDENPRIASEYIDLLLDVIKNRSETYAK